MKPILDLPLLLGVSKKEEEKEQLSAAKLPPPPLFEKKRGEISPSNTPPLSYKEGGGGEFIGIFNTLNFCKLNL